jgi:mono/diheme cytochrome c family protein
VESDGLYAQRRRNGAGDCAMTAAPISVVPSRSQRRPAIARDCFVAALLAMAALLPAGLASAETRRYVLPDETAALRPGPGVEAAQNACLACHSADYVTTQPPGMGATFWEAEVQKMIKAFGAPISQTEAKAISDYLSRTY